MADTEDQRDEIDRLLDADPNAHVVEGSHETWLLTGDQVKVAREALGKPASSQ